MDAPFFRAFEHGKKLLPVVPEIIRDPPHIRELLQMLGAFHRGGAGREAEHHVAAGIPGGAGNRLNFLLTVGIFPGDIVTLDEIHTPVRVHAEQGIIIDLSGHGAVLPGRAVNAVHIRVPGAHGIGQGDLVTGQVAAEDRQVLMGGHAGKTAHDMDAELETEAVHILGQRAESGPVSGGRKTVFSRLETSVCVHAQRGKGDILVRGCAGLIPLNVHDNVFPAVLFEVFGHEPGIAAHCFFRHCGAIAVPAVPAHGWKGSDHETISLQSKKWEARSAVYWIWSQTSIGTDYRKLGRSMLLLGSRRLISLGDTPNSFLKARLK